MRIPSSCTTQMKEAVQHLDTTEIHAVHFDCDID